MSTGSLNQPEWLPCREDKGVIVNLTAFRSSVAANPRGQGHGQGVVSLVLLQLWLNLLCVPLLCTELLLTIMPSKMFPGHLCVYFELMMALAAVNRHMGSVVVAVGRYVQIRCFTDIVTKYWVK